MTGQTRASGQRMGIWAAQSLSFLIATYAAVLLAGLARRPSPEAPIADPWFTLMEALILLIAPLLVLLMTALHDHASPTRRGFGLAALALASLCAGLTSAVHACVLLLSRAPGATDWRGALDFVWPSPVYVLDILAWDWFFALAALCAAFAIPAGTLARTTRTLLLLSSFLSLAGLTGVATADMALRNIGILGYAGTFPIAALCLARRFALPIG